MFGKPEWFAPKQFGLGLWPVTRQGWLYSGAWLSILLLPVLILFCWPDESGLVERAIKSCVWLAVMMGALTVEAKFIVKAMARKEEEKDVFRIMEEEETRQEEAETGKFAMHVTDSQRAKQA